MELQARGNKILVTQTFIFRFRDCVDGNRGKDRNED